MTLLAEDLRTQAHHLVSLDVRKPKQANLRRAISTAYYALFHLLLADCALRMSPRTPAGLAPRIARSLTHSEMRDVCVAISSGNPASILLGPHPTGFSAELSVVAKAFVSLQEARHRADYDIAASYSRPNALDALQTLNKAFLAWEKIRKHDEATVFLAALLFARRWSK